MVADHPEGTVSRCPRRALVDSFDPSVFVDDDENRPTLCMGLHEYKIARLAASMTELAEEPKAVEFSHRGAFPQHGTKTPSTGTGTSTTSAVPVITRPPGTYMALMSIGGWLVRVGSWRVSMPTGISLFGRIAGITSGADIVTGA